MRTLLDGPAPPTAILAGGLALLIGTMRELEKRGSRSAATCLWSGWDDGPLAELSRPPIAVVDRDSRGLGEAAARMALGGSATAAPMTDRPPAVEILPTTFLPRASCGGPRSNAVR